MCRGRIMRHVSIRDIMMTTAFIIFYFSLWTCPQTGRDMQELRYFELVNANMMMLLFLRNFSVLRKKNCWWSPKFKLLKCTLFSSQIQDAYFMRQVWELVAGFMPQVVKLASLIRMGPFQMGADRAVIYQTSRKAVASRYRVQIFKRRVLRRIHVICCAILSDKNAH